MVLSSSAYGIIHSQAGQLLSFVDDLLNKINHHYAQLYEIQKAREEEMLELKGKLVVQIKQEMEKNLGLENNKVLCSNGQDNSGNKLSTKI